MLSQLSQIFSPCPPPPSPTLPQAIPPPLFMLMSHVYKSSLATPSPILYFTVPWLFCNYLFVLLNPFTSLPVPLHTPLI